uniref:NB-ARC domain-containing protein n=2 Tax=Aegilops tauschii TaxID=37682 RepID=A0A453JGC6_AEGTS
GELTSLKRFQIKYCKGIRSLPDSIRKLTNLEYLAIDGCSTLRKWCESQENKMKLAHIRWKVWACPTIYCIAFILAPTI